MVKNETNILIAVSGSMLGLSLLASAVAMQPRVNAASSSASASVTVSAACTLSGANHNYYDTISGGETKTFGPSSIKATCNDTAGYSLYAIGFSGDSYYGDHTKMIGTNANINTATSGADSYWAMQVSSVAGIYAPTITGSFDSLHVIPSEYAQIAKYTSITDAGSGATGSNLQVSYKVSISATQGVDTYTGKVKYTLVHPNAAPAPVTPLADTDCPANSICYAPNAGDIDGSMDSISSITKITKSPTAGVQSAGSNGTYFLITPNYSREGYGFAGWSSEFDATSATNPVIYGPNQNITTSTSGTGNADVSQHGLILYPVWIESNGNLQGWTGCNSLTATSYNSTTGTLSASLDSLTALTDKRDGNTYAIAKLVDGNCWMIENLRLSADDTLGNTNKALAQGYGDDTANNRGEFIGLADSEDANFTSNANVNSIYYSNTQSGTASINIGTSSYPAFRIPRYNNNNTNLASGATNSAGTAIIDDFNVDNNHVRWYSYGNYYNWSAAMANTGNYDSVSVDANGYTSSEIANTSLCPTGWQLPYGRSTNKGATSKGFSYLDVQMGGTGASQSSTAGTAQSKKWRSFPNNFSNSGYFNAASASSRNDHGYYWSSTADGSVKSYYLGLDSSTLNPGSFSEYKYFGFSIRCLASS